jgi:hypothetical protein
MSRGPGESRHLEILEQDGFPDVLPVHKLIFTTIAVSDEGEGVVEVGGSGGGGTVNVNLAKRLSFFYGGC